MGHGAIAESGFNYNLHIAIFSIAVVIGMIAFSVMFYALFKQRKAHKAEIFWVIIPFLIVIVMTIPAAQILKHMKKHSFQSSHFQQP